MMPRVAAMFDEKFQSPIFAAMKVFKFGGASVSTPERIRSVVGILEKYKGQKLLIVVSAIGKTTNALERITSHFFAGNKDEALRLFEELKQQHLDIATALSLPADLMDEFFTEVEWMLHDKPVRPFDYYYDQIVCTGELFSTSIVAACLNSQGLPVSWVDVRDIIRTDANFRDACIDWSYTESKVKSDILPLFDKVDFVLTQGFIGATDENESTTLGREGSDYTAAVFANLLNAEGQTIWKDVQGVMNADPKLFPDASWIEELDYNEVIEMAYYGAQVIHPKTVKPLQNKHIPLYVRSFLMPDEKGTCISGKRNTNLPPIIVIKTNQALVELSSRDFSFVEEGLTTHVYQLFEELKFQPNLSQNAAVSMLCVVDDQSEKLEQFALMASEFSEVRVKKNLELLTIRHYNEAILSEMITGKSVVLRQQTPETVQVLFNKQA